MVSVWGDEAWGGRVISKWRRRLMSGGILRGRSSEAENQIVEGGRAWDDRGGGLILNVLLK